MSCENDCETCFKISIPECIETILVKAGLLADHEYFVTITDKHGNEYNEYYNTDASGHFILDVSNFPDGLFNSQAGAFEVKVWDSWPYYSYPAQVTFCGNEYDAILMTFVKCYNATNTQAEINCSSL